MHRWTILIALAAVWMTTGCEVTGRSVTLGDARRGAVERSSPDAPSGGRIASPRVVITVYGMTTIQGANNVRAVLRRVPGVSASRADIKNGTVTVDLVPGQQPSEAQLLNAVRKTGFSHVRIRDAAKRP